MCDDLEDESKLKMPTFIKSIKAHFEALRDYEEDDAPNAVTQLEKQVIFTQSYQRQLERQEPTLREKIITRLKSHASVCHYR